MEPKRRLHYENLRFAYELAFEEFARAVDQWNALTQGTVERASLKEAEQRLEMARGCYRDRRDRLADFMMASKATRSEPEPLWTPHESALVNERAYRLWESAGSPAGNDQYYWFRAEAIVLSDKLRKACA